MGDRGWALARSGWAPILGLILVLVLALPLLVSKSVWLDEAWVADDVLRHAVDPTSLRTTPIGFEALVTVAATIFGSNNVGFRLVPLLAGIVTVPVIYCFALDVFGRRLEASVATLLLSTNLVFIVYARTLKPYTADALVASLAALFTFRLAKRSTVMNWSAYAALLIVAPLVSFGSLLVIPVAAFGLLTALLKQSVRRGPLLLAWSAVHALIAAILVLYWRFFLHTQRSGGLVTYWRGGFPPASGPADVVVWYASQTRDLLAYFFAPITPSLVVVFAVAILVGTVKLWRSGSWLGVWLCLGPLAASALAASSRMYPYGGIPGGGRILLSVLPGLIVLAAGGVGALYRFAASARLAPVGIAVLLLAFVPSLSAWAYNATLHRPALPGDPSEESQGLIRSFLLPDLRTGDDLFASYGVADALQVYAPEYRRPTLVTPPMKLYKVGGVWEVFGSYPADMREAVHATHPHVLWLLLAHIRPQIQTSLQDEARRIGTVVSVHVAPGAMLERVNVPPARR